MPRGDSPLHPASGNGTWGERKGIRQDLPVRVKGIPVSLHSIYKGFSYKPANFKGIHCFQLLSGPNIETV
jgi:hypothetical protein